MKGANQHPKITNSIFFNTTIADSTIITNTTNITNTTIITKTTIITRLAWAAVAEDEEEVEDIQYVGAGGLQVTSPV